MLNASANTKQYSKFTRNLSYFVNYNKKYGIFHIAYREFMELPSVCFMMYSGTTDGRVNRPSFFQAYSYRNIG